MEARAGPTRVVRAAALQLGEHALIERYTEEWLGTSTAEATTSSGVTP